METSNPVDLDSVFQFKPGHKVHAAVNCAVYAAQVIERAILDDGKSIRYLYNIATKQAGQLAVDRAQVVKTKKQAAAIAVAQLNAINLG
jgi:hypothetical protein